jgi:hypothetical protein
MNRPTKPVGDITRGTTNPNRLRRVDRWMLHAVCPIIRSATDPLVVDLGYGASPITTREMFERFQKHVRPDVQIIGIEIDPLRVAQGQEIAQPGLSFGLGGFEVPIASGRSPIAIRAFNVLRQYDESEVAAAWQQMAHRLAPKGFLVEGTCDEIGRRSTWVAIRAGEQQPETFSISLHLDDLELPSDVAPRLPKALIHRNVSGEKINAFLQDLDRAWISHSALIPFGARQRWVATIESISANYPVLDNKVRWRLGELTVPWEVVSPN